jgi:hypothetical protein
MSCNKGALPLCLFEPSWQPRVPPRDKDRRELLLSPRFAGRLPPPPDPLPPGEGEVVRLYPSPSTFS